MKDNDNSKENLNIGPLNDLMAYQLRRAQVTAFNNFNNVMSELTVTPGQFGVLTLIGSNKGLSQSAVARALGVERSTMVAVIDGLEKRDLVIRRPSQTDRRSNALELSAKGTALLKEATDRAEAVDRKSAEHLSDEERDTLKNLLRKLNSDLY